MKWYKNTSQDSELPGSLMWNELLGGGGTFEKMVRSTKRCLKKLIGRAHFSFDELTTALAETEAVLNSHPLSYNCSEDTEEPITPPT